MKNRLKKLFAKQSTLLPLWEGLWVGLLFIVGSTSIHAQSGDPFGDVNYRQYSKNVMIAVEVMQNGEVLTDAIVAVYCGDDLRGKEHVGSGTNPNLAFVTVYGDYTGKYQDLDFKVYTKETVFTCSSVLDIKFSEEFVGSNSTPYILTLPVAFADNADNSSVLANYVGQTTDIVLVGRTLYKDGDWNTLCLPFNVTLVGSPLAGADARELSFASFSDGILTLNFTAEGDVTTLTAGTPYLIKWTGGEDIIGPVFRSVTIDATMRDEYCDLGGGKSITFKGNYNPVTYDSEDRSVLFLGGNNKLYYPDGKSSITIRANRAYFQLDGIIAGDPIAGARAFVLNFDGVGETDGIGSITSALSKDKGTIYSLTGQRLNTMRKGINIVNGKKIQK